MYRLLLIWNERLYHKNVGTSSNLVKVIVSILAARSRVKLSSALFFLLKLLSSCTKGPKSFVFYSDLECLLCSIHISFLDIEAALFCYRKFSFSTSPF